MIFHFVFLPDLVLTKLESTKYDHYEIIFRLKLYLLELVRHFLNALPGKKEDLMFLIFIGGMNVRNVQK